LIAKKCLLATIGILALVPVLLWAGPQVGTLAPSFTIPDTAGLNHSLADYRGKVVHILFWQST